MYKSDFSEYLSKHIGISPAILSYLIEKNPNIFKVAQLLIEEYGVDKEKLGRAWGNYIGYAYVDPNKSIVNQEYIEKIGISFIQMNKILPLYKLGKAVTFCTSHPDNPAIEAHTQKKLGELVSLVFCFPFDIKEYLEKNQLNKK